MRLGGMGPVLYMVATKLLVGMLGIGLAFAPTAIYPFYAHHPHYWGLSPREDQNLAGLLMALEQSIVMGIALVWLFVRMLNESEREAAAGGALRGGLERLGPGAADAAPGPKDRTADQAISTWTCPTTVFVSLAPEPLIAVNVIDHGRLPDLQPIDWL